MFPHELIECFVSGRRIAYVRTVLINCRAKAFQCTQVEYSGAAIETGVIVSENRQPICSAGTKFLTHAIESERKRGIRCGIRNHRLPENDLKVLSQDWVDMAANRLCENIFF